MLRSVEILSHIRTVEAQIREAEEERCRLRGAHDTLGELVQRYSIRQRTVEEDLRVRVRRLDNAVPAFGGSTKNGNLMTDQDLIVDDAEFLFAESFKLPTRLTAISIRSTDA